VPKLDTRFARRHDVGVNSMIRKIFRSYKEAYSGLPSEAWMLAAVELVNRTGTMVLFFMTLYATRHLGFSLAEAARVMSAYGLGSLVGTYFGGRFCDWIGAYNVQKASLGLGGIFLILLGYPESPFPLAALMFAFAATGEALHPANMTAISQVCPPQIRAKGFALARLAGNLGISVGPVAGGYLALINYHYLFWVDGLTSLAALALFLAFFGSAAGPVHSDGHESPPASSPWKDRLFLLMIGLGFLVFLVFAQLFSTFPLYVREVYGLPENAIGLLITVNTVVIVAIEMLIIHRLQGVEPARVARIGALALCTGFALMPLGRGFFYGAFTVVVWTMGEILIMPLLVTLVASRATSAAQGRYQALLSVSFAGAMIAGPAIGSWVYETYGPDYLWYGCGLQGIVLFAGFSLLIRELAREARHPAG